MSMTLVARRIDPGDLSAVQAVPEKLRAILHDDVDGRDVYREPMFAALNYLVAGDPWEGEEPLNDAIHGGTAIGDEDAGYGPPRYLTPDEVKEIAEALSELDDDEVSERFDADAMNEDGDVFPAVTTGDAPHLLERFRVLRNFYTRAAAKRSVVLLWVE